MQIVRDDCRARRGGTVSIRAIDSSNESIASRGSRDRRCAARGTRVSPMPMQNVFLSSAPHASTGASNARRHADAPAARSRARGEARRRAVDDARDRIVAARLDVAVVHEEQVGDRRQALQRLVVAIRERLLGEIAGRHHQRPPRLPHQQVMERRVRQQQADERVVGRHLGRQRRSLSRRVASTIGRSTDVSRRSLVVGQHGQRARPARRSATMTANGFSSRRLRCRSRWTASDDGGIAGEVKAAEPLDRDDLRRPISAAAAAAIGSLVGRRAAPSRRNQLEPRTADRAGIGLRVEAPIARRPRTRAGTSGHIRNAAIVVGGRSYGTSRAIVKRGPQFVQFVNGYR